MTSDNVGQNVGQNVDLDLSRIEEPAGAPGWYRIEDGGQMLFGPYETKADALVPAEDASGPVDAGLFRRKVIDCDVFYAPDVFQGIEDRNEESVYGEMPPEWPQGEDAAELERRLAITLRDFMRERGLFKEFRALERVASDE